jgi:photosystem II stability/assembly factor-like uncharacterized protein
MKKIVLLIIISFLYVINSYSQSGWNWLNPQPTGVHLTNTYFINLYTGYAVGWNGSVIKTTNGGLNWIKQESNTNQFLTSVFFTSLNTGYITSNNDASALAQIIKTSNAGANWNVVNFPNNYFNSIFFLDDNTGFIGGQYLNGGVIYKTTNGTNSWIQQLNLPWYELKSIYFIDKNNGFAAGRSRIIAKTTNGGNNWDTIRLNYPYSFDILSIFFVDINNGFLSGQYGKIYKSSNAGGNWVSMNSNTQSDLYSIHFNNINTGYAVGDNGIILRTTNSGISWDSSFAPNYLRSISLLKGDTSYCVGYHGTVIKSTNAGISWQNLSHSIFTTLNKYLNSIFFTNPNTGYIAGDSVVLKTINNGNNWIIISPDGNYQYKSIYFLDTNIGFVSGGYTQFNYPLGNRRYAKIYKTTNGGNNWVLKYGLNQEFYHFTQLFFTTSTIGWGAGDSYSSTSNIYSGGIIKTTNTGENWILQTNVINNSFYSIFFTSFDTGYACGHNIVIKTTNNGTVWFNITPDTTMDYYSIYFNNASTGFMTSTNKIYKTTNFGLNWAAQIINGNLFVISSIKFINDNTGFVVGSYPGIHGQIIRTTNNGINWSLGVIPTIYGYKLNDLWATNTNSIYAVGAYGLIIKSTNGGNTFGVVSINENIPNNFFLSQNYPNPFNPNTNIRYELPKNSFVKIVVFDLLGREIKTLVNEKQSPGTYNVSFDASTYPSGVYFYRLSTDDFSETKKMILLK